MISAAPSVRVLANSYSVLTGQTATLECVITANPAATSVQWYKVVNGQQQAITSSPGKYNTPTVNNPNLVISTAQSSDEGYYVCSATNIVATASSSQTFLDVTGSMFSFMLLFSFSVFKNKNKNIFEQYSCLIIFRIKLCNYYCIYYTYM